MSNIGGVLKIVLFKIWNFQVDENILRNSAIKGKLSIFIAPPPRENTARFSKNLKFSLRALGVIYVKRSSKLPLPRFTVCPKRYVDVLSLKLWSLKLRMLLSLNHKFWSLTCTKSILRDSRFLLIGWQKNEVKSVIN